MQLHRYWIRFERVDDKPVHVLYWGCGVTAQDLATALNIIQTELLAGDELPEVVEVIEDVDVSMLDQGHVVPNMGCVACYGIWFPGQYYHQFKGH